MMEIADELMGELLSEVRELRREVAELKTTDGRLPEVMSVATAAKALDKSPKWIRRRIAMGEIPVCSMPGGGHHGIARDEIEKIKRTSRPLRLKPGPKPKQNPPPKPRGSYKDFLKNL